MEDQPTSSSRAGEVDPQVEPQQVIQYFAILSDDASAFEELEVDADEAKNAEEQIVYLAYGDEDGEGSGGASVLNTLGAFQNIVMKDGQLYVTAVASDDDETQQPQVFEGEIEDEESSNLELKQENVILGGGSDYNYEIVEFLNNDDSQIKMVFCKDSTEAKVKKVKKPVPAEKKKFNCEFEGCDKSYTSPYQLTVHMRIHVGKPFQCTATGCDKKFTTNYSLKAHVRTHTGEKPYGCMVCNKHFTTSGDLQKHFRIHTGEKPFVCTEKGCGKSFTTSNIRKVHIRSHTGERPFTCQYPNCGKSFTSSTNFKNHVRIHSGEKPYACKVEDCGKRFTEYSSLYKHHMVHQNYRPYACQYCKQKFKQESAMYLHKRVRHNVLTANDGTEVVVDLN